MNKITPFLWFDTQAEEAMKFYTSVFSDPDGSASGGKDSKIFYFNGMTGEFEIMGQRFMVLNAGPIFKFNEAVSFFVKCKDQAEVDYYWNALTADGGEESQCGWLKDKYGLSWQIVPDALGKCLGNPDPKKAQAALQAMMKMKKIIVADLEKAVE